MGIQVLGPLTVDGDALSPRERSILSALIVRSGSPMSADELADAYWGARPPTTWMQQVKTAIALIRRRVGPATVHTVAGGYPLGVDPDVIDAARFERLVSSARAHMLHGESERAADAYRRALGLWRGPAYPDVGAWPPGVTEAFRLDEVRKTAEEELLVARLALGDHHAVIADAERLVREDPLREERWAVLALADYRSDRQADALATIAAARARLREELGIEPGRRLAELEGAILRQDPSVDAPTTSPAPHEECPYRGLDAFGTDDAATFFGRDSDIARVLDRLAPGVCVTMTGASGCGKSSIALAGVVPRLRERGVSVDLVSPLHFDDLPTPRERAVVVIDQFEELFAHGDAYVDARAAALVDLVARGGTALITVRSDFLDQCLAQPDLARLIADGIQPVLPLSAAQVREVIEAPARAYGLRLEPGLVELVLRDAVDRPTALPMLSHALRETWLRREGSVLTVDGYLAVGGIAGAISHSAEDLYCSLPDEDQDQLRAIMLRLVERLPDAAIIRRRTPLPPLIDDPDRARLIKRLIAARLVSAEADTISVTHEAIGTAWPRLEAWLREGAEEANLVAALSAAAGAWVDGGQADDELLRGARLQAMLDWRTTARPDLTSDETALLDASAARADEGLRTERQRVADARRQNRRLRWALGGATLLLIAATVTGSLAVIRSQEARTSAENSQIEAIVSTSIALRPNDRETAALLATEAYRRWPTDPRVRSALLATVTSAGGLLVTQPTGGTERSYSAAIPGTRSAVRVREHPPGAALEIVDLTRGEVQRTFDAGVTLEGGGAGAWTDVSVSGDGRTAVVARTSDIVPDQRATCCHTHLTFIDLDSGKILPGSQFLHVRNSGLVVLSADGTVAYLQHPITGGLIAVDVHSGEVRASSPAVFDNAVDERIRYAAVAVIDADTVATAVADRIDVFDRVTLALVRSIPLVPGTAGGFLLADGHGGLISSGPQSLARVVATTGEVTWSRTVAKRDACWNLVRMPTGTMVCASAISQTAFDPLTGQVAGVRLVTQRDMLAKPSVIDDRTLLVDFGDGTWMQWRIDGSGAGVKLVAPGQRMHGSPSPDGRLISTQPMGGGPMVLWDVGSATPTDIRANDLALLTDDIVSFDRAGEAPGLQNIATFARHPFCIPGLPDSFELWDGGAGPLAFVFFDGRLVAFDPATGKPVGAPLHGTGFRFDAIVSVSASPDGTRVLVNWYDSAVDHAEAGVFRLSDGELLVRGVVSDDAIFTSSGGIIAAPNERIERIDPDSFDVISTLPRSTSGTIQLAASRDERTLLDVSFSGQARLYDLTRGIPLGDAIDTAVDGTEQGLESGAQLTTDGKTLLTNSPTGVLAWDLRPAAQARAACAIAGRELSAEEWKTYFPGEKPVATCATVSGR